MFVLAAALLMSSLGDFVLQSGQTIEDCHLSYRTYGEMNSTKSNVILFPTWFNGTTADLERYIGPNGLVNDQKFYIITVDSFSNGVSSSPSTSTLQHGKQFPRLTISDMVEAEHKLLTEKLGIPHVYAIMGISMGGMQMFQWLTAYPDFMDRGVSIVGTPRMGERDILLWSTFLRGLHPVHPPSDTDTTTATSTPTQSILTELLTVAPAILSEVLSPQARQQLDQIFQGGTLPGHTPPPPPGSHSTVGGASIDIPYGKNPEDVLHQFEAMVVHDISRPYGYSWSKTAAVVKAKCLVINSAQDKAVSPEFPQNFAGEINAERFMTTGPCGHNAFKPDCEGPAISPITRDFLER